MVNIEKGVPLPNSEEKWAWIAKLEMGDSVFLKDQHSSSLTSLYYRAAKLGIRVKMQAQEGGTRVWRVK